MQSTSSSHLHSLPSRQAARLLQTLLIYAGSYMTMHVQKLLEGLRLCVLDDEADISKIVRGGGKKVASSGLKTFSTHSLYPVVKLLGKM